MITSRFGGKRANAAAPNVTHRRCSILQSKEYLINHRIRASEVRLIGAQGDQLGVVPTSQALQMAEEAGVDLVEVSPNAEPPVCRLIDYGKFKYELAKKEAESRQRQRHHQMQLKEVKFRPSTDVGDYQIKLRNTLRFLQEGDKVKISLRFRGREITHQDIGRAVLKRIEADTMEYGQVEQFPKMEGRQLVMVIAPQKKA